MRYGLHLSTAGKLVGTPTRAKEMGAAAIQIFMGSPRTFQMPTYDDDIAQAFKQACADSDTPAYAHMMYLTAYGTPDVALRQKSVAAARQSMVNAEQLGIKGVVTHMGSHKGEGLEAVMPNMVASLKEVIEPIKNSRLLLEISAGGGGSIGNSIEELAAIYEAMGRDPRIGFCLDTCHMLAGGYEVRTAKGWDEALSTFDKLIGLEHLPVLHLNDSKTDLGSKVDRHENIGDGFIGNDGFKVILNHPQVKDMVGLLEVPGLDKKGPDKANLDRLKALTN